MNKSGVLGDISDQIGNIAKQTIKSAAKAPKSFVNTATSQIGINQEAQVGQASKNPNPQDAGAAAQDSEEIKNFLYAPSSGKKPESKEQINQTVNSPIKNALGMDDNKSEHFGLREQTGVSGLSKPSEKSPEEIQKMTSLKQQLHRETYFDPTFNRPQEQEERQAEKVEREEKEVKMEELKKDEKKPKPIAVQRAQESTEKFRGASG